LICGGDTWTRGEIFSTTDGGNSWKLDTVTPQKLLDIDFDKNGIAYSAGISGYLFFKISAQNSWEKTREDYVFYRKIAFLNINKGLIAAGESFINGQIILCEPQMWLGERDSFPQEIAAVTWVTEKIALAAGYGIVLRTEDGAKTWSRLDLEGDYFTDIHFPSEKTGFVIGKFGTILKTSDSGKNFQKIKDGGRAFSNTARFNSIRFFDENAGFVAGDAGVFWQTSNGGKSWKIIENIPENLDLVDISIKNKTGWVISKTGRVFRFSI
jgi:photosystem II stability/assembly factor-like uncharacterized protein